jgi:hypothetical protein
LKNTKDEKNKYAVEKEKNKMTDFFEREKIKKCKWWKKGEKIKYKITTGLIF